MNFKTVYLTVGELKCIENNKEIEKKSLFYQNGWKVTKAGVSVISRCIQCL